VRDFEQVEHELLQFVQLGGEALYKAAVLVEEVVAGESVEDVRA
jgi:hypothetical protein